ncbi:type I restriction enzyme, S subunit [Tranquillimonas rosea]|uniref:Type I restriction enzyme, S subunit n=1 Tax=Tranquillimonas rosea TaxID=641238 RepID=A0A1H9XB30_9RHOB|nr:restriction endonuclease subunit S [Tranquillimonas rosea]SES43332.1 type I restriction enzyme, S subunit [Tranquillimonas rosea]
MKAYADYKASGVEQIGTIPSHWTTAGLKNIFRIVGGSTPQSGEAAYWDGDIVWITPADLSKLTERSVSVSQRMITNAGLNACGSSLVPEGSLILSTRAPIGSLAIAEREMCTNQGCKALVPAKAVEPIYFYFMLSVSTKALNLRGRGTTFLELSGNALGSFPVPLPPLAEQQAIAAFLDRETAKLDALVEEQRRLIALLKEKRQAVISHAVTRGLDTAAPLKPSGIDWLGDIPAHWEVAPLKYLTTFKSGGTPSKTNLVYWDGDVPWVSARDLKTATITDSTHHITRQAIDDGAASLVPVGSILVLVRGMTLAHSFPVCIAGVPTAINQDLKALSPRTGTDGAFLAWSLRGLAEQSLSRIDEAGHGTKALRMEAWTSMEIPLPPEPEQHVIAEALEEKTEKLDALTAEAARAISLLQERRAALISVAVTGKIDVRDAMTSEEEAA